MLILLINGWIGETRLIKRNGGCGHVWEIHHSDDCYSDGWLVVAQTGDPARANTAKTATKRLGTTTEHHRVQTYQIQYRYVMSCSVVSGLGCHANFPLTHPTFGPDILATHEVWLAKLPLSFSCSSETYEHPKLARSI